MTVSSTPNVSAADVVSLTAHRSYQPDYKNLACARIRAAREQLGLDHDEFAEYLGNQLGRKVSAQLVKRWEQSNIPPGDVLIACTSGDQAVPGITGPLLAAVPPAFPAEALAGPWVTAYEFAHVGKPHYHADIAHITAEYGSRIRAVNHPPEPRSQGRRRGFRNEIEAQLVGRHLVGEWQNTSDTRYCGGLQLAVLPGEIVMEGRYTGVGSDVEVSKGFWKWIRLEPDAELAGVTLREPAELHHLVMTHTQIDVPLTLADVKGEE
jgi:DNA-binding transcriptional regulator YiaG